jgi:hypothetical protein
MDAQWGRFDRHHPYYSGTALRHEDVERMQYWSPIVLPTTGVPIPA